METFHHVERITRQGTALFLVHVPGIGLEWTNNEDDALRYTDLEEAQEDAEAHGGEVVTFAAPAWRGHNAAARLERHFQMAAE